LLVFTIIFFLIPFFPLLFLTGEGVSRSFSMMVVPFPSDLFFLTSPPPELLVRQSVPEQPQLFCLFSTRKTGLFFSVHPPLPPFSFDFHFPLVPIVILVLSFFSPFIGLEEISTSFSTSYAYLFPRNFPPNTSGWINEVLSFF